MMNRVWVRPLLPAAVGLLTLAASPALAVGADQAVSFSIAEGPLGGALLAVAAQSGRRIVFDPAIVSGRTVSALKGTMPPEAAIRRLLQGTGLAARVTPSGDWMVVRFAAADQVPVEGRLLSTVRVAGSADGVAGANGSSDPVATEGTESYTTHATIAASKQPLALKDTPEAISVLTRQQLDDRAVVSFSQGLDILPGVSSTTGALTSRGYSITNVQIDGGSPLMIGSNQSFTSNYKTLDDLSMYDSVTLLRGAAGAFTGVGSPGGVISLERKRPLDHAALEATVQAGSWNNSRAVIDASSPVLFDGLFRVRAVATAQSNDYFYDTAHRNFWQGYINAEVRPTGTTTINIGGKISHERATPFAGLPAGPNGLLLDLPISTCLCTSWSQSTTKTREVFGQIAQKLGGSWILKVNTSLNWQNIRADAFTFALTPGTLGVTPGTLNQGVLSLTRGPATSDQSTVDAFVSGSFNVAGMKVDVTAGGNYQNISQKTDDPTKVYYYRNFLLLPFDETKFPRVPDSAKPSSVGSYFAKYSQRQWGLYGSLRLSPVDWAHLTISERYSDLDSQTIRRFTNGSRDRYNAIGYTNLAIPNFGLVLDVNKSISAYANYQTIFDRNNLVDKNGALLPPVTGKNIEGGIKASVLNGALNVSGSYFYIETTNSPVYDVNSFLPPSVLTGASCCFLVDGTRQTSQGVELQAQGAITRRLKVDASYTYTKSGVIIGNVQAGQGTTPPQRQTPEHLVKIWAAWQPPILRDAFTVGAGLHAETSINPWLQTYDANFNTKYIFVNRPGYVRGDVFVKYTINNNLDFQLNIDNITNKKYYNVVNTSALNFYGAPRSFLITMRARM